MFNLIINYFKSLWPAPAIATTLPNPWIQIELNPKGTMTSAVQIDMTKIQRVQLLREYGKLDTLRVRYADEVLEFPTESVLSFMERWEEFMPMAHADEPANFSNIAIPNSSDMQYKLNPSRR